MIISKYQFKIQKILNFKFLIFNFAFIATFSYSIFANAWTSGEAVKEIKVDGLYSISDEDLLYLLDLRVGDTVDPLKVRKGIKRAFLKGIFEDMQVAADESDKTHLKVLVREKDVIRGIHVAGNTYISSRLIKKHFLLEEGQIMRYDLIDEAVKRLKDDLAMRGFPDVAVSVSIDKASRPYSVELNLRIEEGRPILIDQIITHGGLEGDARELIDSNEGGVYDQFVLRNDMERIKKHYRDLGYLSPEVSFVFSGGTLELSVKEGKKLSVIFEGNTVFNSKTLMKEMPFFEAGSLRDDLIEEAYRRVLSLYHSKGYPFAQVASVMAEGEKGYTIELHFYIYEGKTVSVGAIEFGGVTLPERNLREIMSLKERGVYNPDVLPDDIEVLREFYNALGYLAVDVHEPEVNVVDHMANIRINIKEGVQTVIDDTEVSGVRSVPENEVIRAVGLKKGVPYNEVDISDARYRIIEIYLEHGFVDVEVDVKRTFSEKGAKIIFEISEGSQTFFGKTIITGNNMTKREVVRRELSHREPMPFNYSLLVKERQKLYKLGLFTDVNIETLDKYDDRRDIRINVAEGNAGAVEFGIGYGDYERYRGFFDLSYRNLFGMNRQASLRVELSSLEERYIINYYDPWFLNRAIPFRIMLLREERTEKNIDTGEINYRLRRHTATVGTEKKLSQYVKGELYYEFSFVNTFDVKPDVVLTKEDTGTLAISGIRPGIIYDTRDNPFDPRKGVLAGITMKLASGLLFSETDFAKMILYGSFYKELSKRHVFAASLRLGVAQGFGSTRELPLIERFFLGGRNTVRGYDQDTLGPKGSDGTPTGGNVFLLTNLELRTDIGRGIGLVTFIDGGNVWVKTNDMNLSLKYTAGLGLRYNTPVGPLRVDYGHKLMREAGESSGEIHFSIGHAF